MLQSVLLFLISVFPFAIWGAYDDFCSSGEPPDEMFSSSYTEFCHDWVSDHVLGADTEEALEKIKEIKNILEITEGSRIASIKQLVE